MLRLTKICMIHSDRVSYKSYIAVQLATEINPNNISVRLVTLCHRCYIVGGALPTSNLFADGLGVDRKAGHLPIPSRPLTSAANSRHLPCP